MTVDIEIYTDGACKGNPGPGGWGALLLSGEHRKELFGGELDTTNNKMELQAAIEGLRALKRPSKVRLFTDSQYVKNGIETWIHGWKKNGWKRKEGKKFVDVKNVEFWKRLDKQLQRHQIKYTRVAGHSGHEENDRVDGLAVAAYQKYL